MSPPVFSLWDLCGCSGVYPFKVVARSTCMQHSQTDGRRGQTCLSCCIRSRKPLIMLLLRAHELGGAPVLSSKYFRSASVIVVGVSNRPWYLSWHRYLPDSVL